MSTKEKCQSGCMIFTGGEIKHDENCVFYPESLTKFYADLRKENEEMKAMLEEINRRYYILATEPNGIVRETMIDNLTDGISELIQKHKQ